MIDEKRLINRIRHDIECYEADMMRDHDLYVRVADMIHMIEGQHKINRWIPVEEKLPDEPGDYWVAMRHLDGSVTTEKMFWRPEWPCEDAWSEVVVAWQPYYCPEPFVPRN